MLLKCVQARITIETVLDCSAIGRTISDILKSMASLAARAVAHEVLETIGKGKRPNITKIAVKHGYAYKTASKGEVVKTLTYKRDTAQAIAVMERSRQKALDEMIGKDLSHESFTSLTVAVKNLTHDIQLLSGGSTSNTAHTEDKRVLIGIVESIRGLTTPSSDTTDGK